MTMSMYMEARAVVAMGRMERVQCHNLSDGRASRASVCLNQNLAYQQTLRRKRERRVQQHLKNCMSAKGET